MFSESAVPQLFVVKDSAEAEVLGNLTLTSCQPHMAISGRVQRRRADGCSNRPSYPLPSLDDPIGQEIELNSLSLCLCVLACVCVSSSFPSHYLTTLVRDQ